MMNTILKKNYLKLLLDMRAGRDSQSPVNWAWRLPEMQSVSSQTHVTKLPNIPQAKLSENKELFVSLCHWSLKTCVSF